MPFLFSYGTLQQPDVQQSTFGRLLVGHADALVGFEQSLFQVDDPEFVATSGKAMHNIIQRTDDPTHRVEGMALEVTDADLERADQYEPAGYVRVTTTLASGRHAWVYVAS